VQPPSAPRARGPASLLWRRTRRGAAPTRGGATARPPCPHPWARAPQRPCRAIRGPTRPRRWLPRRIYSPRIARRGNARAVPFWPLSPRRPMAGRPMSPRPQEPSPPSPPPFERHGGCWAPMPWRGHGERRTSPWPGCGSFSSRRYCSITPPQAQPPRSRHCRTPPVPPPSFPETFRPRWRTVTRACGGPPPALPGRGSPWEPGAPLLPMHPGG